jgi:uncharacterized repeat protein (TIGR01451 family)
MASACADQHARNVTLVMGAAHRSLCRRGCGAIRVGVHCLTVTCAAVLASASSADAQLASLSPPRNVRLEPVLEKLVDSKTPASAPLYELAPGVIGDSGEQFVLTLRFVNDAGATIDGVRITSAIPPQLRYVPGSATGPGGIVLFSVDGGRTFGTERELAARGPVAGAEQAAYTHVRWVLDAPIEAGATGFVRLRAESH